MKKYKYFKKAYISIVLPDYLNMRLKEKVATVREKLLFRNKT